MNEYGIWQNKIQVYDIEKETDKLIFARAKGSFTRMRIPCEYIEEDDSIYLGEYYIFRKNKDELIELLKKKLEVIKNSYEKAINGVD